MKVTSCLFLVLACLLVLELRASEPSKTLPTPEPGKPSSQNYPVHWVSDAHIILDGHADEPIWGSAASEKHFVFPWSDAPAPRTEFRAICDQKSLYFTFKVQDSDIVVLDKLRDKEDEVFEDRVEVYLSRDDKMKDYFCFEVDSRGRIFDYRGSFWRKLDTKWHFEGLEAKASPLPDGYEVEGRIPLKSFETLGFPALHPGTKVLCGLYRAEFRHDRSGKAVDQKASLHNLGRKAEGPPPIEAWMSWVDPKLKEPDFHVPATLGWLEIGSY